MHSDALIARCFLLPNLCHGKHGKPCRIPCILCIRFLFPLRVMGRIERGVLARLILFLFHDNPSRACCQQKTGRGGSPFPQTSGLFLSTFPAFSPAFRFPAAFFSALPLPATCLSAILPVAFFSPLCIQAFPLPVPQPVGLFQDSVLQQVQSVTDLFFPHTTNPSCSR